MINFGGSLIRVARCVIHMHIGYHVLINSTNFRLVHFLYTSTHVLRLCGAITGGATVTTHTPALQGRVKSLIRLWSVAEKDSVTAVREKADSVVDAKKRSASGNALFILLVHSSP